ncbi:MAG: DUF4845 domain-containing protein [Pseudomonadota bacterium]
MNITALKQQRGLSMSGFMLGVFFLILVTLIGLKLIPAYMEDASIKNIFVAVATDPEMQQASVNDIQIAFAKRARIDNITAIKMDDVEIEDVDDKLVLSAHYTVKIHLGGNISLYLEFNPSSAQ